MTKLVIPDIDSYVTPAERDEAERDAEYTTYQPLSEQHAPLRNTDVMRAVVQRARQGFLAVHGDIKTPVGESQKFFEHVRDKCLWITKTDDSRETYFVDMEMGARRRFDIKSLERVFPCKYKTENEEGKSVTMYPFDDLLRGRTLMCSHEYRPFAREIIIKEGTLNVLNMYVPPFWMRSYFCDLVDIPEQPYIPQCYEQFFTRLVGGDEQSYWYLIDWLATAIQRKNETYLIAVGAGGIGKGIFGKIMQNLFGKSNYCKCRDGILKEKFNASIAHKRIVYIDEISLKEKEHLDRLKDLVNEDVEVEKKGKDAESTINHASIYISSNNMQCIPLEGGDRRFSVLNLSDKPMDADEIKHALDNLNTSTNIEELGRFLFHWKVLRNMNLPFQSDRLVEMLEAGLSDWEQSLLDYAGSNPPCELSLAEVQALVARLNPSLQRIPGRRLFQALAKKFPLSIVYKKNDKIVTILLLPT